MKMKNLHDNSLCIHAGAEPEKITGAVMPPVFQTSTYVQEAPGKHKGYEYARTHNPTRDHLEDALNALENGSGAIAFASGLAAMTNVILAHEQGSHFVVCDDAYGGTYRLFTKVLKGYDFTFVDASDVKKVEKAIKKNTKALWIETPTNPLLKVLPLKKLCDLAKAKKIESYVDNTFATPILQKPLDLGADLVIHSTTKYIGGHSDVIGGAVICKTKNWYERLKFLQNAVGAVPAPWDCYLTFRGIKTLGIRMERHCENTKAIFDFLKGHKKVDYLHYPGNPKGPDFDLAKKQMTNFGGMISVVLKTSLDKASKVCSSTKLFSLAESLGGVESLIEIPAIMTHASIPKDIRESIGIKDGLIRLSVGIEAVDDLIRDLDQALKNA